MPWFEIDIITSEFFRKFSMYSCLALCLDAGTELRFVLNCVKICSLFVVYFACLKSHSLY